MRARWVADTELELELLYGTDTMRHFYPTIDAIAGLLPNYDPQHLLGWNGEFSCYGASIGALIGIMEHEASTGTFY